MARRRTARRIIVRAIVFLLLGAIVNVAVAWGRSLLDPEISRSPLGASETAKLWNRFVPDEWPRDHLVGNRYDSTLRVDELFVTADHEGWILTLMRAGWPCHAFWGARLEDFTQDSPLYPASRVRLVGLIEADRLPVEEMVNWRFIPFRPLPPGFASNTLFYAAILWLLSVAPFALRRRRRIKRGLCPACAYPIGGSPVCTECGKPVKANKRAEVAV